MEEKSPNKINVPKPGLNNTQKAPQAPQESKSPSVAKGIAQGAAKGFLSGIQSGNGILSAPGRILNVFNSSASRFEEAKDRRIKAQEQAVKKRLAFKKKQLAAQKKQERAALMAQKKALAEQKKQEKQAKAAAKVQSQVQERLDNLPHEREKQANKWKTIIEKDLNQINKINKANHFKKAEPSNRAIANKKRGFENREQKAKEFYNSPAGQNLTQKTFSEAEKSRNASADKFRNAMNKILQSMAEMDNNPPSPALEKKRQVAQAKALRDTEKVKRELSKSREDILALAKKHFNM